MTLYWLEYKVIDVDHECESIFLADSDSELPMITKLCLLKTQTSFGVIVSSDPVRFLIELLF